MNEKKGLIISIVVLALILAGGGTAIYFLQFDYLVRLEQDLQAVSAQVDDATRKRDAIKPLKEKIAKLKEQEVAKKIKIPTLDRTEYDVFADLLDQLRKQAGVTVSKGTWQQAQQVARPGVNVPPTVHRIEYSISAEGSFYQLLRYMNLLEQQKRYIVLDSVSVGRGQESGGGAAEASKPAFRRDLRVILASYTYRPPNPAKDFFPAKTVEERAGKSTEIPE
jgi:hypothetical protein